MTLPTRTHDILEEEYNNTPYPSLPFKESHPAHLYAMGKIFGMNPAPVETSIILELGCASGGNLIPMAFHYPNTKFVGIDLSEKEINDGIKKINDLALKNIILRTESILDFTNRKRKFDYIICHGVYSWVDDVVRDKILTLIRDNLAPHGIAYISYNTLPGWNMIKSVRELMIWHTKDIKDPSLKAKQARSILKFISDGFKNNDTPYAQFINNEINILNQLSDGYMLHDHLSSYNEPTYFYQFIDKAREKKLMYLSDSFFQTMFVENLPPFFSAEFKKINDIIAAGQYMDFIRNQRFRETLLCHDNVTLNRALKTTDVEPFYFQFIGQSEKPDLNENDIGKDKDLFFKNGALTLKIRHPISQWTMYILYINRHRFIHYTELCDEVIKKSGNNDRDKIKQLINEDLNLMRVVLSGFVLISTYPSQHTLTVTSQPVACPLVQYQALTENFAVNRRHEAVKIDPLARVLLPNLNGKNNLASLETMVLTEINKGKLSIFDKEKQLITDENELKQYVHSLCQLSLENYAKQALLIEPR